METDLKKRIDELESAVSSAKVELEASLERETFLAEVDKYLERLISEQGGQNISFDFTDKLEAIKERMDRYITSGDAGEYATAKQMYLKLQEKYNDLTDKIREVNNLLSSFDTTLVVLKNS